MVVLPGLCLNQTSRPKQSDLLSGARITSERQFICVCPAPVSAGTVSFRNPIENIWFAQHNFQNFNCYFFSNIWDRVILGLLPMWNCTVFTRVLFLVFQLAENPGLAVRQLTHFQFNKKPWKWPLCQVSLNYNFLLASLQPNPLLSCFAKSQPDLSCCFLPSF